MEITFLCLRQGFLHRPAPNTLGRRHQFPRQIESSGARFFYLQDLYWLEEYHFDGLRLDAVHAIADDFNPDIRIELDSAIHQGSGKKRLIHLIRERQQRGTLSCP